MYKMVHLELTNYCNFNCPFCPIEGMERKQGYMSLENALNAIEQISRDNISSNITYHLMGEPLLHPHFEKIVAAAHNGGLSNHLVTNGSLLATDRFLRSCQYLDWLSISLRVEDQSKFSKVTSAITYETYLSQIKSFLDQLENWPNLKVRIKIFQEPNLQYAMRALGLDCPDNTQIQLKKDHFLRSNLCVIFDPLLDWKGNTNKFPSRWFGNCREFNSFFAVLVDGTVTTCCWDHKGGNSIGNAFQGDSLMDILNSSKAKAFLRSFEKHRVPTETCAICLARPTFFRSIAYQTLCILNLR